MNEALQTLNHASVQSDRWLFLAMLLVLLAGAGWLIRWLVDSFSRLTERTAVVIQSNTDALNKCSTSLNDNTDAMRHCRDRIPRP